MDDPLAPNGSPEVTRYFLRDPSGKVLSEYEARPNCPTPAWIKDYVYLGQQMVAMVDHPLDPLPAWIGAAPGSPGVRVSWASTPATTQYNIYRTKNTIDAAMDLVGRGVDCNPTPFPPYACTFIDTGVDIGATYYYWVAALTSCYEAGMVGPISATANFQGEGYGPTATVTPDGDEYCDALAESTPPVIAREVTPAA